jgi:pimeloyl-ACP methyl ester carboxylesterase
MADSASTDKLTVVLVHGAFADASSWGPVIEQLQAEGIDVAAPPTPLRGITHDSAYLASFLQQIPGRVLAVGHSYGVAVISNAATDADNVVGLVYIAAFAPDKSEALGEIEAGSKDSVLNSALVPLQYPENRGTATEFAIDPAKFHDAFAADLRRSRQLSWPRPARGRGGRVLGAVGPARLEVEASFRRTGRFRPSHRSPSGPKVRARRGSASQASALNCLESRSA